jgi:hypothetical protein
MVSLKEEVAEALKTQGAPNGSREIWEEIFVGYEEGGSDAVWNLLERKVKEIRRAARAEAAEMKSAARERQAGFHRDRGVSWCQQASPHRFRSKRHGRFRVEWEGQEYYSRCRGVGAVWRVAVPAS